MFPVPPGPRPATRIPLSEGSGEVLAVGAGETRLKPGDRVIVYPSDTLQDGSRIQVARGG